MQTCSVMRKYVSIHRKCFHLTTCSVLVQFKLKKTILWQSSVNFFINWPHLVMSSYSFSPSSFPRSPVHSWEIWQNCCCCQTLCPTLWWRSQRPPRRWGGCLAEWSSCSGWRPCCWWCCCCCSCRWPSWPCIGRTGPGWPRARLSGGPRIWMHNVRSKFYEVPNMNLCQCPLHHVTEISWAIF